MGEFDQWAHGRAQEATGHDETRDYEPEPRGSIEGALERCSKHSAEISELLSSLEERLSAVLRQDNLTAGPPNPQEPGKSGVVMLDRLIAHGDDLKRFARRIMVLTDRIAL